MEWPLDVSVKIGIQQVTPQRNAEIKSMEGKTEGVVGRIGAATLKRFSGTSLSREATMGKSPQHPVFPRRSPIQVLTGPDVD